MTRSSLGSWPADGLAFRSQGQLAIEIFAVPFPGRRAAGLRLRRRGLRLVHRTTRVPGRPRSGYVLRVPCSFPLALPGEVTLTCEQAAARLARRGWEVRPARTGSKRQRWYAWAWLVAAPECVGW